MNHTLTRLAALAALTFSQLTASAADFIVGPGRPYLNITDAIAAAADGDRILVTNRTAVYAESPVITKSLTIMAATEGALIRCAGTWTFAPSAAGKTLTVMNMNLLSGDIISTAAAPAGARSAVRVLGCILGSGRINFNYANFDVTAAADSINGGVDLQFGRVMGNYISGSGAGAVDIYTDGTASNDSVWVVGNRVLQPNTAAAFYFSTTSQYVFCSNNLMYIGVTPTNASNNQVQGISMVSFKTTGTGRNSIVNNTITNNSAYGYYTYFYASYGISLNNPGLNTTVSNNLFLGGGSGSYPGFAISQSGGNQFLLMAYNYARPPYSFSGAVVNNLGNNISSNTSINSEGVPVTGSDAINGGMPEDEYLDIDLTRNDAGCYGGSLSLANFPRFANGTANNQNLGGRVYLFAAPRTVQQGRSLKIRATGFDR